MLKKYILFLKNHPLITALIAVAYSLFCIRFLKADSNLEMAIHRSMLCGAMMFFLYQISGDKTLTASYDSTWETIKPALGFWILSIPLGVISLGANSGEYHSNIPLQLLIVFFMFLFVGLFEELAFRAIINDAIIYRFRDKKYVFVLSAVCSFLFFGAAHVVGSTLDTPVAWVQAILKTIQSGVMGLALLILYWKTRNIWACGIIHGLSDFFLGFHLGIFDVNGLDGQYISSDPQAIMPLIVLYSVIIVIYSAITLFIWFKVGKKIDFQKIREEW